MHSSFFKNKISRIMQEKYPRSHFPWAFEEIIALKKDYDAFCAQGGKNVKKFLDPFCVQIQRNPDSVKKQLQMWYPELGKPKGKKKVVTEYEQPDKRPQAINVDYSANPQAQEVLRLLEKTQINLFITGQAGTGKSTLFNHFREITTKNVVVLAPTGVAAVNVGGQTIHSFCKFPANIIIEHVKRIPKGGEQAQLLKYLDTIVIDEVSMVRADLIDCLDKYLRINGKDEHKPFGGYQMVLIGDLHQLPPVDKDFQQEAALFNKYDSPYFFHAKSFAAGNFECVELKTIYRQQDPIFIDILNGVRNNTLTDSQLRMLNSRVVSGSDKLMKNAYGIYLTSTNFRATELNLYFLNKLTRDTKTFRGRLTGAFKESHLPTDEVVSIKQGAQIMMVNNDWQQRWVNGTMGIVKGFTDEEEESIVGLVVVLENGREEVIYPHTWEMGTYVYSESSRAVTKEIIGTFIQYPIRLAWALTIHKSQGKTFDSVYIDLSQGTFAHGQLYVALSRCRSLAGIGLNRPVRREHVMLDPRVVTFLSKFSAGPPADKNSDDDVQLVVEDIDLAVW